MAASSPVARLDRETEALRTIIVETESEQARQSELAEQASAEREAAALDPVAFGEAARRAAEHRDERDRLGFVLERRRHELLELERRLEASRYADAHAALEAAAERRQGASATLSKALAAAIKMVPALTAARDEYDAALAHARELCPEDIEFELPENADEVPPPDGVDRLVEQIQGGPRRPHAERSTQLERLQREQRNSAGERIRQAVRDAIRDGMWTRVEQLTGEDRERVVGFAEREAEDLLNETSGATRRAKIEQRLERIRELADEAKVEVAA